MKDMKNRIIALILVVVMSLLALCSCGSYDFADEDITYASFDYEAFKAALAKIEIEDGEFTTDEATRLKIAAAKVYNAIVDKKIAEAKEEDRNTFDGDKELTNGDVLYFVYYATLGEQVFFGSQMNMTTLTSSSDKANHVVRLDNYYNEKTNTFAYLIQQKVLEMIENGDSLYAYSTKTKAELEADFVEAWKAEEGHYGVTDAADFEKAYKLENPEATEEQVKAAVDAFKAEYAAAKKAAIQVKAGETYYVSYTRKYETPKKDTNGDIMYEDEEKTIIIYETITEKVAYQSLTLSATELLYETLLNPDATACVGDTAFAAFIKAEGEGENRTVTTSSTFTVTDPSADTSVVKNGVYTYQSFAIKWLVEEAIPAFTIQYTPYATKDYTTTDAEGNETVSKKETTPDSLTVDGTKVDLVGQELTYYIFPVYALDTPITSEITVEDILYYLYGSKLTASSFEVLGEEYKLGDDTVESLLKEISMIFDTKSTVEGNTYYKEGGALYQLNKDYNDAVTAGGSKPTDAQQDTIDTANEDLTKAQNELLKAAITKLVALKNGEKTLGEEIYKYNGGEDATKVITGEYYENTYHSLKESYDSDIIKKVQTAVWDLIDTMVTVDVANIPADLIKDYVDHLYESYEYDFYKGNYVDSSSSSSTSSSTTSNYDHYNGSFDAYLNEVVIGIKSTAKVDKTALNNALKAEAEKYLTPIIKIFVVAKACNDDALAVYKIYVQQDIDGGAYNVDREYYDELYADDAKKAEKKYNEAVKNAEENKKSSLEEAETFLINDAFMKNYKKEVGRVNYNSVIENYGEINVRTGFQFNKLFYYLTSTNIQLNEHGDHTETVYKDGKLDFRTISYSIKVDAPEVDAEGGADAQ